MSGNNITSLLKHHQERFNKLIYSPLVLVSAEIVIWVKRVMPVQNWNLDKKGHACLKLEFGQKGSCLSKIVIWAVYVNR